MATHLLYNGKTLRFDAVTSETTTFSSAVTEHPVEIGPNITDHVRAELESVTLECVVSNTPTNAEDPVTGAIRGVLTANPIEVPQYKPSFSPTPGYVTQAVSGAVGDALGLNPKIPEKANALSFRREFNAITDVHTELLRLRDTATIVQVVSADWTSDNMIIRSVSKSKVSGGGGSAVFSIELKQIVRVETKRIALPEPKTANHKRTTQKGSKPGTTIEGEGPGNPSLAYSSKEAVKGFFQ